MPIVKPPETIADWEKCADSTRELMANPYCDIHMFVTLTDKLKNINEKIEELKLTENE